MSRLLAAVAAACLWAGCASAEDANPGGTFDFAVAGAVDDLARPADLTLPLGGGGDAGSGCPAASHVVVNEVKTGSAASASDEFIELYNPCALTVDLTGFSVVYRSAAGVTDVVVVSLTKTIGGNGWLLIAGPAYSNGGTPDQTYGVGRLAAAGGGVGLRDGALALVDSVGYGSATNAFIEGAATAAPPNGQSIARQPNGTDTGHNDLDFAIATTPTPRAAN
ncbi:MAG: lamin tail domain-containing protein [Polyangia bacterium]